MKEITFWFPLLKLMHVGGLILWLGPSGGAWLLVQLSKRRMDQQSNEFRQLYQDFLKFFWLEHLGLFLLLGSGILLLITQGYPVLDLLWLKWKIGLILCVIVPIEIADIWFGHVQLPQIFSSQKPNIASTRDKINSYDSYERRFAPLALPPLLLSVIAIMWLAIARPV
ncbi:hypothetical protein [Kaarinaea lacus]